MAPSTMKQSTLSFGTRKSSSSTSNASKKPEPVVVKRPTRASLKQVDPIEEGSDSDQRRGISGVSDIELSSEEDEDEVEDEVLEAKPIKKQEEQTLLFKNVGKADRVQTKDTQLELDPDDDKWDGVYRQTQITRGTKKKIHGEGQDRIHEILNVFDMTYKYGPCIGLSRMQRWQRAKALGLDPPEEIHDILMTRQGKEKTGYAMSVFDQDS